MDTEDPNELGNYNVEGSLPSTSSIPVTEKGSPNSESHPLITVLTSYLKRFPLIGRWTIMEDVLEHTLEIRVTLSKRNPE
jgi:hypothetical protein